MHEARRLGVSRSELSSTLNNLTPKVPLSFGRAAFSLWLLLSSWLHPRHCWFVSPQFFCLADPRQGASRGSFSRGHCCWVKAHGLVAGEMSQRVTALLFKCRNKSFGPKNSTKSQLAACPPPHIADEMEQEAVGSLETRLLSIAD